MRPVRFIPVLLLALAAGPGFTEGAPKWRIGGGAQLERYSSVKGHIGTYQIGSRDIEDVERSTINIEYRPSDHIGIGADLAISAPLIIRGQNAVIESKASGIAAMGRYYFTPIIDIRPFMGLGLVYSVYDKEKLHNSPSNAQPDIENSFGPIFALGLEMPGKKREIIRAELSYHRSAPQVLVDGRPIGKLGLNPVWMNLSYLLRF